MTLEEITNKQQPTRPRRRYHDYQGIGDWLCMLLPRRSITGATTDLGIFWASKAVGWPAGGWAGYELLEPLGEEAAGAAAGAMITATTIYATYKFLTDAYQRVDQPNKQRINDPYRPELPVLKDDIYDVQPDE